MWVCSAPRGRRATSPGPPRTRSRRRHCRNRSPNGPPDVSLRYHHFVIRDTIRPGNTGFTEGQWPGNGLLTGFRQMEAAPSRRSARECARTTRRKCPP
ncbi:hypothetical protein SGPA1_31087 [Streptomyces misionensis JCM 4497]